MCKSCGTTNQSEFSAEICIHFLEPKDLDKPPMFVFPKIVICLDCGFTEFAMPETELRRLGRIDSAAA